MTHTGTLCAINGRGGPNVSPLTEPAPTGPFASHTGFVLASHVLRHRFTPDCGGVGKLCEMPVHPLSRPVPESMVGGSSSSGPPAGFLGHVTVVGGMHISPMLSTSFFGLPVLDAFTWRTTPGFVLPFFITLSGIGMSVVGPHAVPLRSEGFVRVAFFTLM